ncbi:MAG: ComF family protein [Actinomycetota bacterium]
MRGRIVEALFPRACAGCRGPGWPFCHDCRSEVAWLTPPGCFRCGRPLLERVAECSDCPPSPITWARAPFLYAGPIRRALLRLKFAGERSIADAMAPFVGAFVDARLAGPAGPMAEGGPFTITWVPLGRRRRRTRSFDQAEVLARSVAAWVGAPVRPLLARVVETDPQARRSAADRRLALEDAFAAVGTAPPSVVLVDDVLTTGFTSASCARTLVAAGARSVHVLTAARSLGGPLPARCYNGDGFGPGLWLPGGILR